MPVAERERERCITYVRFPERQWRRPPAPKPPRVTKDNADPRQSLAKAVDTGRDSYAALSVMLGHAPGYLKRFVDEGVPRALSERDHGLLSDFFGVALGHRDLWLNVPAACKLGGSRQVLHQAGDEAVRREEAS